MIRIVRRGTDLSKVWTEDMADEAALACILSGDAVLSEEQIEPPFLILGHVEAGVADGRIFGPAVDSVEKLQMISERLFQNGMRLNFADGREILWFQDVQSLTKAAIQQYNKACFGSRSLMEQVKAVRVRAVANTRQQDRDHRDLWQTDRNSPSWINVVRFIPTDGESSDSEWADYKTRVGALTARIDALILDGLREGRILCSEDLQHGSRFQPPSIASLRSRKAVHSFCFSSGLPEKWLALADAAQEELRRASEWMHRVVDELDKQGKIATIPQVVDAAVAKFKISKAGAENEWASVRENRKKTSGSGNFCNKYKVKPSMVLDVK